MIFTKNGERFFIFFSYSTNRYKGEYVAMRMSDSIYDAFFGLSKGLMQYQKEI